MFKTKIFSLFICMILPLFAFEFFNVKEIVTSKSNTNWGFTYPALYDLNKDGKKDLLVGQMYGDSRGNVSVYTNTGTSNNPSYSGSTFLQAGNSELSIGAST